MTSQVHDVVAVFTFKWNTPATAHASLHGESCATPPPPPPHPSTPVPSRPVVLSTHSRAQNPSVHPSIGMPSICQAICASGYSWPPACRAAYLGRRLRQTRATTDGVRPFNSACTGALSDTRGLSIVADAERRRYGTNQRQSLVSRSNSRILSG